MANSSAKKLHKANTRRLNNLCVVIFIPTLAYVLRWFLFSTPTSSFHKIVFVILTLIHTIVFSLLWLTAKPTYSKDGALIDAGDDISKPGMLEYAHDILYLTVFVQLLLLLTRWALVLYLALPAFVIYLSCCSGGTPFPDAEPEDQNADPDYATMSRKERRKAERFAKKHRS